ncbi:MAG: DMT family transporter [Lachnospiraceae bacterium]|jgi:Permeases of the drug/metabolite transporter (DMT) superfamily|nr:DMT family transporter [Lachnospiraceae bacterium]
MNRFVLRQSLILFLTACIWGLGFIAQSVGMDYVEPFTFTAARNVLAFLVLVPYIALTDKGKQRNDTSVIKQNKKILIIGGICCGICLFAASTLQQFGVKHTTVGKAGFITAMYMVLVPIFGVFLHKKAGMKVWTAVALALLGMYFLCITKGEFRLQLGDSFVFACAVGFTFHILVIDYFSPKSDGVKLSCIQFLVCAALSTVCMLIFEKPDMGDIFAAGIPILYAGVLSSGVAYTLQIVGQKGMNPTVASLILSLESVVSVLAGWLILDQKLSVREICGCVLAFAAIILVQLPDRKDSKIHTHSTE